MPAYIVSMSIVKLMFGVVAIASVTGCNNYMYVYCGYKYKNKFGSTTQCSMYKYVCIHVYVATTPLIHTREC